MDRNPDLLVKRALIAVVTLVALGCVYVMASTIIDVKTTSVVHINTAVSQAAISVGQANHEAKLVGTGKATVRLKPGQYQVTAKAGSSRGTTTLKVVKGEPATVSVELGKAPHIRSVDDLDFNGLSSLTGAGITDEQLAALQLDFFRYKTSIQTVTIDGDSLVPSIVRNPGAATTFTMNFAVTIDSVPYKATINYSSLDRINLLLYSAQDNGLVFNSETNAIEGGE